MEDKCSRTPMQTSLRSKQPLRRLQNALNSCINVAIPMHIELLNKHKSNIEKFQGLQEWSKVQKEQINASRTVEQLKADIWSLDLLRSQVDDASLPEFDKQTKKPQEFVKLALQHFVLLADSLETAPCHRSKLVKDWLKTEQIPIHHISIQSRTVGKY